MKRTLFIAILAAAAMFGCAAPTPEPSPVPSPEPTVDPMANTLAYYEFTEELLVRWEDAYEVAQQTPRMNLSGPIGNLQTIHREAEAYEIDDTDIMEVHTYFESFMELSIDGYLKFMGDDDSGSDYAFEQAGLEAIRYEVLLPMIGLTAQTGGELNGPNVVLRCARPGCTVYLWDSPEMQQTFNDYPNGWSCKLLDRYGGFVKVQCGAIAGGPSTGWVNLREMP